MMLGRHTLEDMNGENADEQTKKKNEDYYLKRLIAIHNKYEDDIECNQSYSDDLLVDILRDLGWDKLADEYESTYKWYA